MKRRKLHMRMLIMTLVFGMMLVGCSNGTTPELDEPTRWISINGLDKIGLNSFNFSVLLTDSDNKGITIGLIYKMPENAFPEGIPDDVVLKSPLIASIDSSKNGFGFEYTYWHGSGDYYVKLFILKGEENKVDQKWKSNELIHFSDDSPNPVLSLTNAHLE